MSMIRCDLCETLIDSDADPACFVEGNPSGCFCRSCRDQAEEETERAMRKSFAEHEAGEADRRAQVASYNETLKTP